jgi:hypothetical protein
MVVRRKQIIKQGRSPTLLINQKIRRTEITNCIIGVEKKTTSDVTSIKYRVKYSKKKKYRRYLIKYD